MEIKSILIKDTTREERIRIVQEGLNQCGGACDFCNGCDNLGGGSVDAFYEPYINGEKELREIDVYKRQVIERGQREMASFLEMINRKCIINNMINDNLSAMAYDIYMHNFFSKEPNSKLNDILIEAEKSVVQVGEAKTSNGEYPSFLSLIHI